MVARAAAAVRTMAAADASSAPAAGDSAAAAAARGVREVSGLDLTLAEAIAGGQVPRPPLCYQREWLTWRSTSGKRPSAKRTGEVGTQIAYEMHLWKQTMEELYGADWLQQLASVEVPEEEDAEEDALSEHAAPLDIFRGAQGGHEDWKGYEQRLLRVGRVLQTGSDWHALREDERYLVTLLAQVLPKDEAGQKAFLQLAFFETLMEEEPEFTERNRQRAAVLRELLRRRGVRVRDMEPGAPVFSPRRSGAGQSGSQQRARRRVWLRRPVRPPRRQGRKLPWRLSSLSRRS